MSRISNYANPPTRRLKPQKRPPMIGVNVPGQAASVDGQLLAAQARVADRGGLTGNLRSAINRMGVSGFANSDIPLGIDMAAQVPVSGTPAAPPLSSTLGSYARDTANAASGIGQYGRAAGAHAYGAPARAAAGKIAKGVATDTLNKTGIYDYLSGKNFRERQAIRERAAAYSHAPSAISPPTGPPAPPLSTTKPLGFDAELSGQSGYAPYRGLGASYASGPLGMSVPPAPPPTTDSADRLKKIRRDAEAMVRENALQKTFGPLKPMHPLPQSSPEMIQAIARGRTLRAGGRAYPSSGGGRMDHAAAIDRSRGFSADYTRSSKQLADKLIQQQGQADRALLSPLGKYPTTVATQAAPQQALPPGFAKSPNEFRDRQRAAHGLPTHGPNTFGSQYLSDVDPQTLENAFLGLPSVQSRIPNRTPEQMARTSANQEAMAGRLMGKYGAPERTEDESAADYIRRYRKTAVLPKLAEREANHKRARAMQGARTRSRRLGISMADAMADIGYRGPQRKGAPSGNTAPPYNPDRPVSAADTGALKSEYEALGDSDINAKYGVYGKNAAQVNQSIVGKINSGEMSPEDLPGLQSALIAADGGHRSGFRSGLHQLIFGGSTSTSLVEAILKAPNMAQATPQQRVAFLEKLKSIARSAPPEYRQ